MLDATQHPNDDVVLNDNEKEEVAVVAKSRAILVNKQTKFKKIICEYYYCVGIHS
jgi:hypothetical protein